MKVTLNAYLSGYALGYLKPEDLKDIGKVLPQLSFSQHDLSTVGHTLVGHAEVDVDLLPPDQIVGNMVLSLRAKAKDIRAKASAEATALEGRVQQLLALENKS